MHDRVLRIFRSLPTDKGARTIRQSKKLPVMLTSLEQKQDQELQIELV